MTGNILCIANFRANTGYAWDHINMVYRDLAGRTAAIVYVAYASLDDEPRTLRGSRCQWVEMRVQLRNPISLLKLAWFIRTHGISTLYLTDRQSREPAYAFLRTIGVRRIIVHRRTVANGQGRRVMRYIPGAMADVVVCVSGFVRERQVRVLRVPEHRTYRIWDALTHPAEPADIRRALDLPDRPVIACASRAAPGKGIEVLLRAFDRLDIPASLVYMGDGPTMDQLREQVCRMRRRADVLLAGYRTDARQLVATADLAVVPSTGPEAFGLAALEPMSAGVPVIASRIGGLPEVVGDTGVLVSPGDSEALTEAMRELLADAALRADLGRRAKQRAETVFDRRRTLDELARIVLNAPEIGAMPETSSRS